MVTSRKNRRTSARFRTGAHGLEIERGRWSKPLRDREARICSVCKSGEVEDESHFLFRCPAYAVLRSDSRFQELFDNGGNFIAQLMTLSCTTVCDFVADCSSIREQVLSDLV
jgi:hypothetical protein